MFSKTCKYALKALLYISTQSLEGKRTNLSDITRSIASPKAFTGKVLGTLSKNGIIRSYTGPNGGFDISLQQMKSIRISDVVLAIDGDDIFVRCPLGFRNCNDIEPCPLHEDFATVRDDIRSVLDKTSVFDAATKLQSEITILLK